MERSIKNSVSVGSHTSASQESQYREKAKACRKEGADPKGIAVAQLLPPHPPLHPSFYFLSLSSLLLLGFATQKKRSAEGGGARMPAVHIALKLLQLPYIKLHSELRSPRPSAPINDRPPLLHFLPDPPMMSENPNRTATEDQKSRMTLLVCLESPMQSRLFTLGAGRHP